MTPSIWEKIDPEVVAQAYDPTLTSTKTKEGKAKRRRRYVGILDAVAFVFWTYAAVKVFVIDIDRALLEQTFPAALPALKYRIVFFLVILALIVGIFRRYYWGLLYVALFPLVVVAWKTPRLLYRLKSWLLVLGLANALASFLRDLKYNIISKVALLVVCLTISLATSPWLQVPAVVAAFSLLAWSYVRTIKNSLGASRFIQMQNRFLEAVSDNRSLKQLSSVKPELRSDEIDKFDKEQFQSFFGTLQVALVVHKGVYYWAYQLEQYRRSAMLYAFGLASYVGLLFLTVLTFSLANYALLKADPDAFTFESQPSFMRVVWYSLWGVFNNGIDGLAPASDLAIGLTIVAGLTGAVLLVAVGAHFVQGIRTARQESAITDIITKAKNTGRRLNEELRLQYDVGAEEALRRLQRYGRGLLFAAIEYMSARIPNDFEDQGMDSPNAD